MVGDRERDDVPMDDELARRLRELEWPKPPRGLRERSLEELRRHLDTEREPVAGAAVTPKR